MQMRRCVIDGRTIRSLDNLYDLLTARLELPGHFGRNLDALWDTLSGDIPGPLEIVWQHADDSKKALGANFDRLMKLLEELEGERDDFTLRVEP